MRQEAARVGAGGGASAMKWPLIGSAAGHLALAAFLLIFMRAASGPGFPGVVQVDLLEEERTGISPGGGPNAGVPGAAIRTDPRILRQSQFPPSQEQPPAAPDPSAAVPLLLPGRIAASDPGQLHPGADSGGSASRESAPGRDSLRIPISGGAPSSGEIAARAALPGSGSAAVMQGSPGDAPRVGGTGGGGEGPEIRLLRERIESRIVYPPDAIRRGQEGEVLLRIRVGEGGVPREIRVARSSGARTLDEAARNGVTQAVPLPSRPGWFEVPVRFRLR